MKEKSIHFKEKMIGGSDDTVLLNIKRTIWNRTNIHKVDHLRLPSFPLPVRPYYFLKRTRWNLIKILQTRPGETILLKLFLLSRLRKLTYDDATCTKVWNVMFFRASQSRMWCESMGLNNESVGLNKIFTE